MSASARKQYVYQTPFDLVAKAYQSRFQAIPHPKIPALTKVQFSDYAYDEKENALKWTVRGYIKPPLAQWILSWCGVDTCCFVSVNTLYLNESRYTVEVRNEELADWFTVEEHNEFRVHPENEDWTLYTQDSKFTLLTWFGGWEQSVADAILAFHVESFEAGRAVDEEFVEELRENIPERGFLEQVVIQELGIAPERHH